MGNPVLNLKDLSYLPGGAKMATAKEQREAFLKSRGITPKGFNRAIRIMVEKECKIAEGKLLKKRNARWSAKKWKCRKRLSVS